MTDYERGRAAWLAEAVRVIECYREAVKRHRAVPVNPHEAMETAANEIIGALRALSPGDWVAVPKEGAVERMARAIYRTKGYCYMDEERMFVPIPWEDADDIMRGEALNEAETAFRAMLSEVKE